TGIARFQMFSLGLGIVGTIACVIGFVMNRQEFLRAYLPSWIFWFEIVAGALAVLMLQYITGGEWGVLIRRPLGAAARTMILMAALFLPIAFGVRYIYPWADPNVVAHDPILHAKQGYLNVTFWLIRSAAYFGLWI